MPRPWLGALGVAVLLATTVDAQPRPGSAPPPITVLLGRPTDRSIALNLLAAADAEAFVTFGATADTLTQRTGVVQLAGGVPSELTVSGLAPNRRYSYQLQWRRPGGAYVTEPVATWHTQRAPGQSFVFTVQGDSHPERLGRMYDPALYQRTLMQARESAPDFHLMLGDDFSIERLIARGTLSQSTVNAVYAGQRPFLDLVGRSSVVIPVNGNHEEAGRFLLDGTPTSPPVLAGLARTRYFALPEPDAFYSGDTARVAHVGLPRDYFAWSWGDALFVVIDPYWHTPATTAAGEERPTGGRGRGRGGAMRGRNGGGGNSGGEAGGGNAMQAAGVGRDMWQMTLGDAQYAWLSQTLRNSRAKWKFVFAHHVLGTGRGGVELADSYEWGGRDRQGAEAFRRYRPTWTLPIHQLFAATGVTIFFQGHDHLFARQEKDGVVYQSTPNPADPTYTAFNRDAYRSGDILPNSGHLRVQVSPTNVQVDYVRAFLPSSENATADGRVAFTYRIR